MCGFIGMIDRRAVAPQLCTGLQAIQHRGQDSCGIATFDGASFPQHKGLGLVREVFDADRVSSLNGNAGLGHVRYPTIGKGVLADAQPFFERRPGVLVAHNGNVTNYERLRRRLLDRSIHLVSKCDVEPILCVFAEELMARRRRSHTLDDVVKALRSTYDVVQGAFSLAFVLEIDGKPTLVGARDPHGIRPATWGRKGDAWMLASESVALDALGFELLGDLKPGHAVFLRAGEDALEREVAVRRPAPCVFESIYFSRPDSIEMGATVYERRLELGRRLARSWKAKDLRAERVISVPDTSRPAALAFAEELGLPAREGFIKNRYSGRTFIMADDQARIAALRLKLNPIRAEFEDRHVVVVDDSIVRGNTVRRLIDLIWAQGPRSVHFAIHAPPVLHPCFYGIDMSTAEELAAPRYAPRPLPPGGLSDDAQAELERVWAEDIGVTSLTFLSVRDLDGVFPAQRCAACFDGRYPLLVDDLDRSSIAADRTDSRLRPVPPA